MMCYGWRSLSAVVFIRVMMIFENITGLYGNRDFWKKVDKVTKNNTMLPNMIDEVTGGEHISKLFVTKYDDI